jgi:hypothetical protein
MFRSTFGSARQKAILVPIAALITLITVEQGSAHAQFGPLPATNQGVLAFAKTHIGTQVGNGQCGTLAYQALNNAGAANFDVLGPTGDDADYVWGTRVATLTPASHATMGILPGDVIQFRNVLIKTVYPNGSWTSEQAAHHTAIVSSVSGNTINVLEQNANGVLKVEQGSYNLSGLQQGTMWVYRPIPKR